MRQRKGTHYMLLTQGYSQLFRIRGGQKIMASNLECADFLWSSVDFPENCLFCRLGILPEKAYQKPLKS
jgi:hypothetical protein